MDWWVYWKHLVPIRPWSPLLWASIQVKNVSRRNWYFARTFSSRSLKIFWRISRTIMTPVNKEFNYLHLSTEKDFLQRVVFLFWEILRLKVESRILRLMLKTFPISQVWDGGYYLFVVYMLRLKNIDNALDIGRYLFVKTASSVRCVVNPAIFLLARIGVRSRIWGKTLNVLDASR